MAQNQLLRSLPCVNDLMQQTQNLPNAQAFSHAQLLCAVRNTLDILRKQIRDGEIDSLPSPSALSQQVLVTAEAQAAPHLMPVINATGVILHTNLGRAVLAESVAEHVKQVAMGYSTLEYDLQTGTRGSRHSHVEGLICSLTGAEAAIAVNNNAAAVLLTLSALCNERDVIVSRGELVEIGGSFRIPEIISQGGAQLKEVGTTNKTRLSDYQSAVTESTAALLKVHNSNFKMIGFTEEVSASDLCSLGQQQRIPVIYDLGSGVLEALPAPGPCDEPTVPSAIADGVDVVCFSGDKLLGGPQAGIIAGRKGSIDQIKRHPLARALRMDKLTLAALEATLQLCTDPETACLIPTRAMLCASEDSLRDKAIQLLSQLPKLPEHYHCELQQTQGQVGGGCAPELPLPSWAVALSPIAVSVQQLEEGLRSSSPPVIGRISKDTLLLDVRTIKDNDFSAITQALADFFNRAGRITETGEGGMV